MTDDASVQKCIADTIKEHGRLDCLINNAGFGTQQNVEQACNCCISTLGCTLVYHHAEQPSLQPCCVLTPVSCASVVNEACCGGMPEQRS